MKFLVLVAPPSNYHGCSTWKTFWEEKFTGKEYLFLFMNMKNYGCRKVSKHKEIKGSDKSVTLDISSKFDSINKIKTTYSESKGKLERSVKGLVTALDFKIKVRSQNYKSQGMPSEMSVRRTFRRLSKSLRKLVNYLTRRRGPNMSLTTANFIY